MKKLLITGLIIAISVFVMFGCSDDTDCPTCPQFTQTGLAMFEASIDDSTLNCFGAMFGLDGQFVDVDSVIVDTFKMDMEQYFGEGMGTYCSIEGGMEMVSKSSIGLFSTAYTSGDTIELKIYTPKGVSQGSVQILDRTIDEPIVYDWLTDYPYDTVALNTGTTVAWAPIPNADFYAVNYRYRHDHDGVYQETDTTFTTNDTTFVVPSSFLGYNGRVYFYIYALNGPKFTDAGNVKGGDIIGRLNSMIYTYFRIYIGTGDPYPDTYAGTKEEENNPKTIKDFLL